MHVHATMFPFSLFSCPTVISGFPVVSDGWCSLLHQLSSSCRSKGERQALTWFVCGIACNWELPMQEIFAAFGSRACCLRIRQFNQDQHFPTMYLLLVLVLFIYITLTNPRLVEFMSMTFGPLLYSAAHQFLLGIFYVDQISSFRLFILTLVHTEQSQTISLLHAEPVT